jgi:hypothetical protein
MLGNEFERKAFLVGLAFIGLVALVIGLAIYYIF